MMKSLSVGVSSTGCLVNSLSKLEVSRLSLCQMESKHINTAWGGGDVTETCQLSGSWWRLLGRVGRGPVLTGFCSCTAILYSLAFISHRMLATGEKTWWTFSKKGNETLTFFKDCQKIWCARVCCVLRLWDKLENYLLQGIMSQK